MDANVAQRAATWHEVLPRPSPPVGFGTFPLKVRPVFLPQTTTVSSSPLVFTLISKGMGVRLKVWKIR